MELMFSSERLDPSYDFYDENPARFPMMHWNPKVDQSLQDIVYKMCCIKRADRWQTAQEAIDALEDWKGGKAVITPPAPVIKPAIVKPVTPRVTPIAPRVTPITAPTATYKICSECGGLVKEKFCMFCGAAWQGKTADKICKVCAHWVPKDRCIKCGELYL